MSLFTKTPADRLGFDLLDRLPLGVAVYRMEDLDDPASFRVVYANPAAGAMTGLDVRSEVGRRLVDVVPGVEATDRLGVYADVIRTGEARDLGMIEYGDERVGEGLYAVRAIPLGDDALSIVFEDVGERAEVRELREAQEELSREASRSRTLLDAVGDVVLVYPIGPEGAEPFVAFNTAAAARYGYTAEELRTMRIDDLVDGDRFDTAGALDELRKSRQGTFESVHRTRDGQRLYMSTHARLVEYDGRLCVVALCRDDAHRRQFRREIARANRELEEAVAQRTRQLEAFSEDLKILHGITTAEHETPQARYEAYLRAGCEMFDLPIGILSSTPLDPETGERLYRIEAVVSPDPDLTLGMRVPIREAFCDAVIEQGQTVTYGDAEEEAPEHPACASRGLRAFIGTPVVVDGETIGTLNFVSPDPRAGGFSDVERDLIEVMAEAVSRRIAADRAEAAQTTARERYRSIVETVDAGVIVVAADLRVILSNPSARLLLGLDDDYRDRKTDDMTGRWPVLDAEGRQIRAEDLPERRAVETGEPVRGVLQGVVPPGQPVRWYRVNATPLDDDGDGSPDAAVVSFHDVTDLHDAALAAERSQDLLRAVLAASGEGVVGYRAVRDEAGAIVDFEWVLATERAGELVGRDPGELVGRRLLDEFPDVRENGLFEAYARVVATGEPYEAVVPTEGAAYRVRAVPLGVGDGLAVTLSEAGEGP